MQHQDFSVFTLLPERSSGVYSVGLGWQLINNFGDDKDWDFNGHFQVVHGHEFFDEGKITFTHDKNFVSTKRVMQWFGPCFAIASLLGGYVYANAATNMVQRHMKKKYPESKDDQDEVGNLLKFGINIDRDEFDDLLRDNQERWYKNVTDDFIAKSFEKVERHVYGKDLNESRHDICQEKHEKQALRQQAFYDGLISNAISSKSWVKSLEWKGKYENVKPGKPIRVFVDAKPENSLARVDFANSFKKHMSYKEIVYGNVLVKFCSGSRADMIGATFTEFLSRDYDVVIYNFSDDSMVKFRGDSQSNGFPYIYNVDIASNDSSHSFTTFDTYAKFSGMPQWQKEDLERVIRTPFKITNPENPEEFVLLRSTRGYLPSGIGDTSVCNNMIYLMLGYTLNALGLPNRVESLTYAGFVMGFRFSYQLVTNYYEMQFLKHSVCRIKDGICYAMPNLGIMLRYCGKSVGDLPGGIYPKGCTDLVSKAKWYQSLLTYGFFKYFRYPPIMGALCPNFSDIARAETSYIGAIKRHAHHFYADLAEDTECEVLHLTRYEFYSRYLNYVTTDDIDQFETYVSASGPGTLIYCRLVDVVMGMDYGYKRVTKET